MAKYIVVHWDWEDGHGWRAQSEIDSTDTPLTADELRDGYEGYYKAGDEIRLYEVVDEDLAITQLRATYIVPPDYKAAD